MSELATTVRFESELGVKLVPYLTDHRVQGAVLVPGTAYLEMILASASEFGLNLVSDVEIKRPLFLPDSDQTRTVRLTINQESGSSAVFEIVSRLHDEGSSPSSWTVHVVGKIAQCEAVATPLPTAIDELRRRCHTEISGSEHHRKMAEQGLRYGPTFQGLRWIWRRDGEALAEVHLPELLEHEAELYHLHPAFLDACLRALYETLPPTRAGQIYLPTGVGRLRIHRKPECQVWSHAVLRACDGKTIEGDVTLLDEFGDVLVEAEQLRFQRLEVSGQQDSDRLLYEIHWRPQTGEQAPTKKDEKLPDGGIWLILADQGGVGKSLAGLLEARRQTCITVFQNDVSDGRSNGSSVSRFETAREKLLKDMRSLHQPPCGIVSLWSLDFRGDEEPTLEVLEAAQSSGCVTALNLVQAIHETQWSPRMWFVTCGAQPAGPSRTLGIAQSPIWGFGRVMALEHPDCWGGLVDLDSNGVDPGEDAAKLLEEILRGGNEDAVAFRGNERYVARLVSTELQGEPCRFRPDATYLITGGLGDLGLSVSRWMVENGARRLLLLGRTRVPPRDDWRNITEPNRLAKALVEVQELENMGASIHVATADVADRTAVASVLNEIERQSWPLVRGIIHAAGVVDEEALQRMTLKSLAEVMRPKIAGTWVLHELSQAMPLDFFVCFSSIASVWGSTGLAHYAAANHFMDAVAHHRRSLGLPATSINWGPWAETGMAARPDREKSLAEVGLRMLQPKNALDMMGPLMAGDAAQAVVASVDWNRFKTIYEARAPRPFLAEIMTLEQPVPDRELEGDHLRRIVEAAADQRCELIKEYLQDRIAVLLGLSPSELDVEQSLNSVGLDSLMAAQVKNRIEKELGVPLPIVKFLQGSSIADLAEEMSAQLSTTELAEHSSTPADLGTTPWRPVTPAPAEERHTPFPLTDLQQAYWVGRSGAIQLSVPASGYFEYEIDGLDVERLTHALWRVIDRHDMLRMIVLPEGRQKILAEVPQYRMKIADLSRLNPEAREARIAEIRREMFGRSSPSDVWPLFEIRVSHLDGKRSRLHIWAETLLADAISLELVSSELDAYYRNPALRLPPLEFSYRDYVLALQSVKRSEAYRRSREYWFHKIPTLPPGPQLPQAKNLATIKRSRFVRRNGRLDGPTWSKLKDRAAQAGLTPAGVMLTAYAEVIGYWNRSHRLSLAVLFGNRVPIHPQIVQTIGNFNEPTVLSVEHWHEVFEDRARALQEQFWQNLDHSYFSGVEVLREITRLQGGTIQPLLPVALSANLKLGPRAEARRATPWPMVHSGLQVPQVYLDANIYEDGEGLNFHWDAVEEVFPTGLVDEMFGTYREFLQRLAEDERAWREPRVMLPALQARARTAVNTTAAPIPAGLLHDGISEQTRRCPQAVAVVQGENRITYAELERWSNQLGHRLRALGVKSNQLVAVVMDKGWEQVVAVLGILKAGGAYLPIEAGWPEQRICRLLKVGEVGVVVTQPWIEVALTPEVEVLKVEQSVLAEEKESALVPVQNPEDLAYVIFTSGSTGEPKGVMIDHRSALNTVVDINHRFGIGAQDRLLGLSSLSFDLSVYDIFGMLTAGGTLLLPERQRAREPEHWVEIGRREGVTVWNSVPAMLEMLVEYAGERTGMLPPSLRLALLSGDWIPLRLPDRVRTLRPEVEIVSLGGATEASIWSIHYRIGAVDPQWKSIPYGTPLANQQFHVLNEHLEPCPVWAVGELYIGGVGLAKGYWRDTVKTAERFITHPQTGERLYRTGDLGRYWPDGTIEFLGREDNQVKVRGYRIELGEIEARLRQHAELQDAIVAVRETAGSKRLVAYVVPKEGGASNGNLIGELEAFVRTQLPEYMVPAGWVELERLPLSANGKVDRSALPLPASESTSVEEKVSPRTPVEERLASLFAELLGVAQVGIHDNFFHLGGHSLLAARLVFEINKAFGKTLPLSVLFTAPTVDGIAKHVASGTTAATQILVPMQPHGTAPALFCFHPAGGEVIAYQPLAFLLGNERPLWGLQSAGLQDVTAEYDSIGTMAETYLAAIRAHQPSGPYHLLGWSMGGTVAMSVASLLERQGEKISFLGLLDSDPAEHTRSLTDVLSVAGLALGGRIDHALSAMNIEQRCLLVSELEPLSDKACLERIVAWAREQGIRLDDIPIETLAQRMPLIARHLNLLAAYDLPVIQADLHVWWASENTVETQGAWSAYTSGTCKESTLPGGHFSLLRSPNVERLARDIVEARQGKALSAVAE